jgi:hypothetical protein
MGVSLRGLVGVAVTAGISAILMAGCGSKKDEGSFSCPGSCNMEVMEENFYKCVGSRDPEYANEARVADCYGQVLDCVSRRCLGDGGCPGNCSDNTYENWVYNCIGNDPSKEELCYTSAMICYMTECGGDPGDYDDDCDGVAGSSIVTLAGQIWDDCAGDGMMLHADGTATFVTRDYYSGGWVIEGTGTYTVQGSTLRTVSTSGYGYYSDVNGSFSLSSDNSQLSFYGYTLARKAGVTVNASASPSLSKAGKLFKKPCKAGNIFKAKYKK